MNVSVRLATPEDARAIAEVHVRAWQVAYAGLVPQTHLDSLDVDRRAAWWSQILTTPPYPTQRTWVALVAGTIAGFATAGATRDKDGDATKTGELQAIYVAPASWRSGAGSALLIEVFAHLREHSFTDATLWMVEGNTIGSAFYVKHGWRSDGAKKHEVWDGTPMDEVRYRIDLQTP